MNKIIVVGMDNTGKTTLVNQLKDYYECESIKSLGPGYSRQEMIEEIKRKMSLSGIKILERFSILEECVYGEVLRNNAKFSLNDMDWVLSDKPFIIYCRPDLETIYNFGEREQMEGVIEKKQKLVAKWDEVIDQLIKKGFTVIFYDWKRMTIDDIIKEVHHEHYTR